MSIKSMTSGAPWKHIIKFAFPVFVGLLLQQLYNTVDTIVVGNFTSEEALAAVGTTASFVFMFLAIATGFSAGTGVLVAQYYGAKNEKAVRENAATGILFLLTLGIVIGVIGALVARPALKHFIDVPDSFLDLAVEYFVIYSLGLLFQYGYNIFSAILRAVGDSAATLYFLLIASVLNIVLDVLFVAYFKWGVAGAAIATDISQAVSFIAAYIYMRKRYSIFRFKISEYVWNNKLIKRIIQIGFPISMQLIIVSFGLTLIQRAVNGFGKIMTASFTVGQRVEMYLNLPGNTFQTTLATFTAQNIGAEKYDRVRLGVRQTMMISFFVTVVISLLVYTQAENIISFFGLSKESTEICIKHLRAIAIINLVLSMYFPMFGFFQGVNHSAVPMFVAIVALTLRVLSTYAFRYSSFLGESIIWWNGIFGFGAGFIIIWSYYFSGKWKKNMII